MIGGARAWWANLNRAGKFVYSGVGVLAVLIAITAATGGYNKTPAPKPTASAKPKPTPAATVSATKCQPGTHLTTLGWCLSNKPSPPIKITAADRAAAAIQNDATVCAGDVGCLVARPLKRRLIASGVGVQSLTCINDAGDHLKCAATLKDGSAAIYDVVADPSTGRLIYQLSP